jgi:hypothetical protein
VRRKRRASNRAAVASPRSMSRVVSSVVAPTKVSCAPSPATSTSSATESPRAATPSVPPSTPRSGSRVYGRPNAATLTVSSSRRASSQVRAVSVAIRPDPRTTERGSAPSVCTRRRSEKRKSSTGPSSRTRPVRNPWSESATVATAPTVCTSSDSTRMSSGRRRAGSAVRSSVPDTVNRERAPPARRSSNSSAEGSSRQASSGPPLARTRPRTAPSQGAGGIESPKISCSSAKSSGAAVMSRSRIASGPPTSAMNPPRSAEPAATASSESMAKRITPRPGPLVTRTTARPLPLSGISDVIHAMSVKRAASARSVSASRGAPSGAPPAAPKPTAPSSDATVRGSRSTGSATRMESRNSATRPAACWRERGGASLSAAKWRSVTSPAPEPSARREGPSASWIFAYSDRTGGSPGAGSGRVTETSASATASESSWMRHRLDGALTAGGTEASASPAKSAARSHAPEASWRRCSRGRSTVTSPSRTSRSSSAAAW